MKLKKYLTMILIISICLVSISAVNAVNDSANSTNIIDNINENLKGNNEEIIEKTTSSFNDLNNIINKETIVDLNNIINKKTVVDLNNDYAYTDGDESFKEGIIINHSLTINGNGHTIDGSNIASIFQIIADNVTLNNITFINGYNCNNGGAIKWCGDNGIITYSNFINNTANYGGAIYWKGYNSIIANSCFDNNTANVYGGAISWEPTSKEIIISMDYEDVTNHTSYDKIYWNGKIINSNFTNNNNGTINYGPINCDGDGLVSLIDFSLLSKLYETNETNDYINDLEKSTIINNNFPYNDIINMNKDHLDYFNTITNYEGMDRYTLQYGNPHMVHKFAIAQGAVVVSIIGKILTQDAFIEALSRELAAKAAKALL